MKFCVVNTIKEGECGSCEYCWERQQKRIKKFLGGKQ